MAGQVFSTSFIWSHSGEPLTFDPVDGYRIIVRWLTAFNAHALEGQTYHLISSVTGLTIYQNTVPPVTSFVTELRVVVPDGEGLRCDDDGDIDLSVSGYLLKLP